MPRGVLGALYRGLVADYVYNQSGRAVGYIQGRCIHDIYGKAVGQLNGNSVHTLSGCYVGELDHQMVVDKGTGDPGNIGHPGDPGNAGMPGDPGNRGSANYGYRDVSTKLLG